MSALVNWNERISKDPASRRHQLARLRDLIVVHRPDLRDLSLVMLHGQLFADAGSDLQVPNRWTDELLALEPRAPFDVLLRAEALRVSLAGGARHGVATALSTPERNQLDDVLTSLLAVMGLPPRYSNEAIEAIARFATWREGFEVVMDHVADALNESPMGFRAWRIVALALRANAPHWDGQSRAHAASQFVAEADVQRRVRRLFNFPDGHLDTNPARGLDIEAAAATPREWGWATEYIRRQALDTDRTPRQRGYAAIAHWSRTRNADDLGEIINTIEINADAETELGWVRLNLDQIWQKPRALRDCISRTQSQRLVEASVRAVIDDADVVAADCRAAAVELAQHALLSNHGLARRRALDSLRSAGLARTIASGYSTIVSEAAPPWLQERTCFALGFLGDTGTPTAEALGNVLRRALDTALAEYSIAETAAWAVGEVWASDGPRASRRSGPGIDHAPSWVQPTLVKLAQTYNREDARAQRVTRGAMYSLSVLGDSAAQEPLRGFCHLRDEAARRLAAWGLARYEQPFARLVDLPLNVADPAPNAVGVATTDAGVVVIPSRSEPSQRTPPREP